jgi:anti-sigma B factor antagonist
MSFFYITDEPASGDAGSCDDVAMLVAGGDIDFAASPQLRERLADYVSKGKRHLVVDLSAVTFIDSTAIGVLVGAVMRLREHEHGTMTVVCAEENKRVLRIFDIAGVENLIELHGSRAEALLALAMAS